jgi:hypothetical protein
VEEKESLPTEDTPVILQWQLKQGATFDTEKKALEQIGAFLCVEQERNTHRKPRTIPRRLRVFQSISI